MSEENEPITEETTGAQPAAEISDANQPDTPAAAEPPKGGKSRKKGKRASAPEPEPLGEEAPSAEPVEETAAPLAPESTEQAGDAPSEGAAESPAEETEVTAEAVPVEVETGEAQPAADAPAESDTPIEPSRGRKSRKKGKRSEESAATSEETVSEEGTAAESASDEAASPEEAEAQETVEPADERTRLALPLVVEAILFASQKPMSAKEILSVFKGAAEAVKEVPDAPARAFVKIKEPHLRDAIESLEIACASPDRAYEVRESAAGWQLVTKPEYSPWLRQLFPEHRSARLSAPAMETLAIIAYRQPITRADIEAVRGVAVDGVMQTLLDRGLVKIAGRADVPGRPLLYDTTQNFMEHFGLKNLDDLPNAAELRKISLPTAEPPAADPPAATEAPSAPASPEAPAETVTEAAAEVATETSEAALVDESAEAEVSTEPAEAAEVEASEAEPAAEFAQEPPAEADPADPEPELEISETPISPEASDKESRTEN